MIERRAFLRGIGSVIAAPAIVPFASLMPVRGIVQEIEMMRLGVLSQYFGHFSPRGVSLFVAHSGGRSAVDIFVSVEGKTWRAAA